VINTAVRLVTEECYSCGVLFAMPQTLREKLLADHSRNFYCPNGHDQHYIGKTDAQLAQERAERLERQLANRDEDLRAERAAHRATKGNVTKLRKRVANGVCPCCNRSFANLHRHMENQHPDYAAAQ
jgi:DNA repair exonuclease SbcCD ATPase subunit